MADQEHQQPDVAEPAPEVAADAAAPAEPGGGDGAPDAAPVAADEPAAEKPEAAREDDGKHKEVEKECDRSRERSRSRDRRRDRDGDREHRGRSRSRSRDRRRSRSRERRRRSRSRSRSRSGDRNRSGHRSRRSRFDDGSDSDREERKKKDAAAAAPAAGSGPFPGPPGAAGAAAAADPYAALRAANPALANLDPNTANMLVRQQMMLQQQLLLQQQAALQAQQVMAAKAHTPSTSAAQRNQEKALKAQRELFVGNLAPGVVTEQSLYQVFTSALVAAYPQAAQPGQEPVVKVSLSGRFAFVEFRLPEYATAALQLNGQIALMGNTLKIARPSSYVEPSQMIGIPGAVPGALPTGGLPGLAGLPGAGSGPMSGNLAALAGVPGVAGVPGASLAGVPGVGALPGLVGVPGGATIPGLPGVAAPAVGGADALAVPTPYLCVAGMVTADVLADESEYKEVICDLHQECSKHGMVVDVKVPRPPPGTAAALVIGTEHYGKAYVQFADIASAQKAKEAIHGRMFAGNTISAYHVSLPLYHSVPPSLAA